VLPLRFLAIFFGKEFSVVKKSYPKMFQIPKGFKKLLNVTGTHQGSNQLFLASSVTQLPFLKLNPGKVTECCTLY